MTAVARPRPFAWVEVERLVVRAGWSAAELGRRAAASGDGLSLAACRQRVERWKSLGLTVDEADRVASALGVHPSEVFDGWWDLPPVDVDAVFQQLRSRARRQRGQQRSVRRVRARRVVEYGAVERARARGPHRCAPDGCCARLRAADDVLTEAA